MRKLLVIMALFLSHLSFAQNAMDELKNSIERSEGGSGVKVQYLVHLTPANVRTYYGDKYDSGTLVEVNGKSLYFELSKKIGEERETVIINIESASLIEFEIVYVKGKCNYKFDFYY
jgi:hypothetical protein